MLTSALMAAALTCAPPPSSQTHSVVDATALLALRDVSGLSLSPDGSEIAYQLQQADLSTNAYRSVWCVAPIDARAPAQLVGDGGDILMPLIASLGRPTGMWNTLAARWRPDGGAIAFIARRNGESQIDVCSLSPSHCHQATHSAGDVRDFTWTHDGAALIYQARPSRELARELLQSEGDGGFHLDDRFDVFHSLAPIRMGQRPDTISVVDLATGQERPASDPERDAFNAERRAPLSTNMGAARSASLFSDAPASAPALLDGRDARDFIRFSSGFAWTAPAYPNFAGAEPPLTLFAAGRPEGGVVRCAQPTCIGRIIEMAATRNQSRILFIKREGWDFGLHALYLWDVAANRVRRVWAGEDIVRVCWPRAEDAICLREGPTQPRQIVRIDYATGAIHVVVDPNADLPRSAFAPARKLEWRTARGDDVFGYLVLPPGRRARGLPLIVVQYRATGFLRGGVGDEYPVQAFAHRGFAVLVLERPDPVTLLAASNDAQEIDRREWQGLSERWRTLAALTSGIELLARTGVIDRARVGVTGLSDGAETTVFGLIHCGCIAAAAISSGVHDPISYYFSSDGERAAMRAGGRGAELGAQSETWGELSLARNAMRVTAPILAQAADREAVFMLEAQRTFADLGRPFDLYVFPNEFHVKWQPRHRAAIYERSLDWFRFWLLGETDPSPAKAAQYARWRAWSDGRARQDRH